jgi:hypothetical protein
MIIRAPLPANAPENPAELTLTFNNGDRQSLRETVERLGFVNEESILRFALAVLAQSATRSLTITNQNGLTVALNPNPTLLSQPPIVAPVEPEAPRE